MEIMKIKIGKLIEDGLYRLIRGYLALTCIFILGVCLVLFGCIFGGILFILFNSPMFLITLKNSVIIMAIMMMMTTMLSSKR